MITYILYIPWSEIKETTKTSTSASYLDLLLSVIDRIIPTKLYDKRDDFDFRILIFPYICSNILEFSIIVFISHNFLNKWEASH